MKLDLLLAAVVVVWALAHAAEVQEQIVVQQAVEDNHVTCSLSGDPELSTFTFQEGSVPFPCFSHLADMRLEFNENSSAVALGYDFFIVDIFASAGIQPYGGRYFVDMVTIEIGGYAYIDGTDRFRLVDEGTYKTSSNNVETFWNSGQTPQDEAEVWDINSTFPPNVVRTGYDAAEQWAFLKLLRLNNPPLEFGFRPRNKTLGIPQTPRPGAFIKARRGPMKAQPEARFPDTLCSTKNDDRTFREIKRLPKYGGRLTDNRQLMLYTVYTQALNRDVDQTEPKCTDAVDAFENCEGEAKRQQAMRICSPLTTARTVRCLESLAPDPGTALVAFTKCVNVCCDVDKVNSQLHLGIFATSCPIIQGLIPPTLFLG